MLEHINQLQNIGTFDSDCPGKSLRLKRTTFVYAENGRGKTTLSAILRSLASGNPQPILERKRIGSDLPPRVILQRHEKPSSLLFKDGAWTHTLPELRIFDDIFVDENVYSGLSVDPQHRRNLHELILGEQGVTLNRKVTELVARIEQHNIDLEEKKKAVPQALLYGFSIDEFCDLQTMPDVDKRIEKARVELEAARRYEEIQSRPLFETLELPEFDIEAINGILRSNLSDLNRGAEARVRSHVQALGVDGESWVERGFNFDVVENDKNCPFCGQSLSNLPLLDHYSAYFSESYTELKQGVADMIDGINNAHADNIPASFERSVGIANTASQFWNDFVDVPQLGIDTATIVNDWKNARETVVAMLKTKQSAPVEELSLDNDSLNILDTYNSHRSTIREINKKLDSSNQEIRNLQRLLGKTNEDEIKRLLMKLRATRTRHLDKIAPLCQDYIDEKNAKINTETERDQTRTRLNEYRSAVFPRIETVVNTYLQKFNADFKIENLKHRSTGRGTGSTCDYSLVINNFPINISKRRGPDEDLDPSFRNSLSAGDRNTLALAFFFSSLDEISNLSNSIVVIDDPMASLDEHRANATIQKLRELTSQAKQVIVLSHNKQFLCNVWSYLEPHECCSLEITLSQNASTIRAWNIHNAAITLYDKQHERLRAFAENQTGDAKTVVMDIRPTLEDYLRVTCPADYPPGVPLEPFLKICRERLGTQGEILNSKRVEELNAIKEYTNPFHHGTNPARPPNLNTTELLSFVKRTLRFTNPFANDPI